MAKKWTKEERIKDLWEKYHGRREKAVIITIVIVVIVSLLILIYYSLAQKWGLEISIGLFVLLFIWIVLSVFFLDTILWEGY